MFKSCATSLEETANPLKPTREAMFNAAALYGDLVAVGVIPCSLFNSIVNGFLECLTSVSSVICFIFCWSEQRPTSHPL